MDTHAIQTGRVASKERQRRGTGHGAVRRLTTLRDRRAPRAPHRYRAPPATATGRRHRQPSSMRRPDEDDVVVASPPRHLVQHAPLRPASCAWSLRTASHATCR